MAYLYFLCADVGKVIIPVRLGTLGIRCLRLYGNFFSYSCLCFFGAVGFAAVSFFAAIFKKISRGYLRKIMNYIKYGCKKYGMYF